LWSVSCSIFHAIRAKKMFCSNSVSCTQKHHSEALLFLVVERRWEYTAQHAGRPVLTWVVRVKNIFDMFPSGWGYSAEESPQVSINRHARRCCALPRFAMPPTMELASCSRSQWTILPVAMQHPVACEITVRSLWFNCVCCELWKFAIQSTVDHKIAVRSLWLNYFCCELWKW
jgi:hypothetical protein